MTAPDAQKPKKIRQLATKQDLDTALAALTSLDLVKLGKSGEIFCAGSEYATGDDLLGEAVYRAYRAAVGETTHARPWPTNIPIQAFLYQTMRSLGHGSRHSAEREDTFALEAMEVDGTSAEWVLGAVGHFAPDHLSDALEQEELQARDAREESQLRQIEELFKDDVEIQCYLEGIKEGRSAAFIRDACGWNETQYASILTRYRRKLKKLSTSK